VISKGKTLAEATDIAIARYNRKHGIDRKNEVDVVGIRLLEVRGWVS
jgi:hypothetical protein